MRPVETSAKINTELTHYQLLSAPMTSRPYFIGPIPLKSALILFGFGLVLFVIVSFVIYTVLQRESVHFAAREGDAVRVAQILERHPEWVNQRSRLDLTPLLDAAWHGKSEAMQELIRRGADVNATWGLPKTGDGGWNGLHIAANFGQPASARLLLDAGTNVNSRTLKGETPLDIALRNGRKDVADLLRARGGKTTAELDAGNAP